MLRGNRLMKVDLTGRVALVTGAARGIGQAIADLLVANDATVIYSDRDFPAAEAAASAQHCRALLLDVTDESQVEQSVAMIANERGRLDIVVNNAGVNTIEHRVPIDRFPREEWD